ncbi:hypothetical protein [Pseudomonas sp. VEM90]
MRDIPLLKKIVSQTKTPRDRAVAISIAKAALVFLSLGTVHYVGFLMEVPLEIVSIVSLKFVASFVGTFTFYLTFCYIVAKVLSFSISQFYYSALAPLAALTFAASKLLPNWLKKPARRMHRETNTAEKLIYWVSFVFIFIFAINFSYLKFNYSSVGKITWVSASGMAVAAFLKCGILIRPRTQVRRILDKKRIALRKSLVRDYSYLIAGLALVLSYYTGMLRFEKIMTERLVDFKSENHQGQAHVLLSVDGAYLLAESNLNKQELLYINDGVTIRLPIDLAK